MFLELVVVGMMAAGTSHERTLGQQTTVAVSTNRQDRPLIARILDADVSAIEEAGRSGDRSLIPYLQRMLMDSRLGGSKDDRAPTVRVALAKLGDINQQQQLWCEANREDPRHGVHPKLEPFRKVGGWFGIHALEILLSPEGQVHFERAVRRENATDLLRIPPRFMALELLPQMVSDPPIRYTHADFDLATERQTQTWRAWIAAHRERLMTLEPTGAGVDFSDKACKKGKPVKKQR